MSQAEIFAVVKHFSAHPPAPGSPWASAWPPPVEPERIIRCSHGNLERAICRAFARCREWGEFWRVEVVE